MNLLDVFISPLATLVNPGHVYLNAHISIDQGVYLSTRAVIGNYVHIAPNTCIIGGKSAKLIMEDFTNISANCTVICASDDFTKGHLNPIVPIEYRNVITKPVIFKRFSAIGCNTVVLPGVILAEGSVVGAGSVLTDDTEPWGIYVGSPAKRVGTREKEWIIKSAKKMGYDYDK
jgi:acetyltransferase-like isoleucine patch superfamily enzyme